MIPVSVLLEWTEARMLSHLPLKRTFFDLPYRTFWIVSKARSASVCSNWELKPSLRYPAVSLTCFSMAGFARKYRLVTMSLRSWSTCFVGNLAFLRSPRRERRVWYSLSALSRFSLFLHSDRDRL